jgi:hypothetical protein
VFEEFEDQKVIEFMYDWNQKLYNQNPVGASGGAASLATKRFGYGCDIILKQLNYKKETLVKAWKFVHAWPSQIQEIGLDMGDNNSVKLNAQFTYDYWILMDVKDGVIANRSVPTTQQ